MIPELNLSSVEILSLEGKRIEKDMKEFKAIGIILTMKKKLNNPAVLVLCILLSAFPIDCLCADDLTVYSYRDENGSMIVVDSFDKVPQHLRHTVESETIRSFSGSTAGEESPVLEEIPDGNHDSLQPIVNLPAVTPPVQEPVESDKERNFNDAVSSATVWIGELNHVHQNLEKITLNLISVVKNENYLQLLHTENLQKLDEMRRFEKGKWKSGMEWFEKAHVITENLRAIEWSISRFLQFSGKKQLFAQELTVQANRIKAELIVLSQMLSALRTEK